MTASQAPLVFEDVDSFEEYWPRCIVGCSSVGIYLLFSQDETRAMGFGEEDHRVRRPFSSRHIKGTY